MGVTWATLWAAIGAGIGYVVGLVSPGVWTLTNPVFEWAVGMGLYGLVSGVGFGSLLSLGERRKRILELSLRRATRWGVLGAAAVPLLFGALGMFEAGTTVADVLGAMLVTALLGGTSAPASIWVARNAALQERGEIARIEAPPDGSQQSGD